MGNEPSQNVERGRPTVLWLIRVWSFSPQDIGRCVEQVDYRANSWWENPFRHAGHLVKYGILETDAIRDKM